MFATRNGDFEFMTGTAGSESSPAPLSSVSWRQPGGNFRIAFVQEFAALPSGGVIQLETQWGNIPKIFVEEFPFRGPVPEPSAALLFIAGGLVVGMARMRAHPPRMMPTLKMFEPTTFPTEMSG